MQKDSIKASLGDFVIDLGQGLLFFDGEEISIEPKVMELLLYLHDCRGRYVTVEELHSQVWTDRVVTDTAVRGTVKKLRVILKDDDLNNPKYIKSVAKRGYKLVCDSNIIDCSTTNPAAADPVDPPVQHSESLETTKPEVKFLHKKRHSMIRWGAGAFILFIICLLSLNINLNDGSQFTGEESLTEFNGEKKEIALSSDGRFVAFTGRHAENESHQVYIFDKQEGTTRKLTTKATNARFPSFAQNDKVLVFSDLVLGASSLKLLPLTVSEPESAMVTLLKDKYWVSDAIVGRTQSEVLIKIRYDAGSAMMLYALDLESLELTRLFTPTNSDEHIITSSVSPDKTKLIKLLLQSGKSSLVVHDFDTQLDKVLSTKNGLAVRAVWLSNNNILLLDNDGLHIINARTGESKQVRDNPGSLIWDIAASQVGDVVAIRRSKERADRLYIERALTNTSEVSRVINTLPEVTSMMFDPTDDKMRWVRFRKNDVNHVGHFNIKNDQLTTYFETKDILELLAVASTNEQLLVKEKHRLAILSLKNRRLEYFTADSSSSSDGVFYQNDKSVLFGVKVGGEWEIQKYDIESATKEVFLRNFKSIRPTKNGFVAANDDGDLYLLTPDLEIIEPLGYPINFESIARWHVKQNGIIWSDFDYLKSYVHHIDLETREHTVIEDMFFSLYPRISVNPQGSHIVYLSVQINDSAIQQLYFK
ncbi:transcriptional regulator [Pseudoalteromonas luteoviolacea]|uniref:OmpR/PhoB-type domain-containing protein n=1 Tax=Pseudoalteromonas luteoviolacea S4054 TaxID=1129367 RepID=A0A0F6AIT7_9GAMM|nr:winged helix-turn-helix domain-containing protein [Pseudoalteromonas luteoviolacea]AOT06412.1 hypothetical protein S4054249_00235 [Pseudoalteromonas luteoviolacea]AOT11329.1 hypothetical protein S40542_00235 [Pseudoalteromonas luteoviolacea]AOT16242.1 hypothetical protein S4054_00235 [Pseudoalteromonas luteoviolacea]KKE85719.1 hypothetical protein N479_24935 [Pseudoalteromonas luteoviolacea S4054]KZN64376.1 hypothetical protein N481_25415 [Pseudoalteromonas luteoviolacea S4047-1]